MSMWLGPPASHSRITDLRRRGLAPRAFRSARPRSRSRPGSERPPRPNQSSRFASAMRREMPSRRDEMPELRPRIQHGRMLASSG